MGAARQSTLRAARPLWWRLGDEWTGLGGKHEGALGSKRPVDGGIRIGATGQAIDKFRPTAIRGWRFHRTCIETIESHSLHFGQL
jgi:hypothetical protein